MEPMVVRKVVRIKHVGFRAKRTMTRLESVGSREHERLGVKTRRFDGRRRERSEMQKVETTAFATKPSKIKGARRCERENSSELRSVLKWNKRKRSSGQPSERGRADFA